MKWELLLFRLVCQNRIHRDGTFPSELIEYGFEKAREDGYKAVIVEGNPQNYIQEDLRLPKLLIFAGPGLQLPGTESVWMVKEIGGRFLSKNDSDCVIVRMLSIFDLSEIMEMTWRAEGDLALKKGNGDGNDEWEGLTDQGRTGIYAQQAEMFAFLGKKTNLQTTTGKSAAGLSAGAKRRRD